MTAAAIFGLISPRARCTGSVCVIGCEVLNVRVPQRPSQARVAMVFQDTQSALNPLISIGFQLEEPLRRHGGLAAPTARQAARTLLASIVLPDMDAFLRTSPAEISGGHRQRICIALALACRTDLILADEPTTALDVVTQAQVLGVLKETTSQPDRPCLLFVTHDLAAALRVCERVLVLAEGRIVEDGPIHDVLSRPRHPFTRDLVDCAGETEHFTAATAPSPEPA
ncbi:ATP-binding cassette domain-containing protein [Shinella sp. DD12]|uniref:ATP-binding cassette domain-containing protein n=1 Tax=Shinella sp. DD12 TaxID=1410620 RepID=UPI0003C56C89|nr:ATP-binding cassette domain-containing protein [Shinella sp. DD12]EYR83800.1 putative D,D-dipeptide transport ATP-binding protein DdpD [Shinella sp. DD12]